MYGLEPEVDSHLKWLRLKSNKKRPPPPYLVNSYRRLESREQFSPRKCCFLCYERRNIKNFANLGSTTTVGRQILG